MVYNYFDGDDLSKLPNEKCQLLFNLLDVTSEKEILDISITNDYLQRVGSQIFDTKKSTTKKEESIDLAGLKKDEIMLIGEISQMLKNILIENKGREGEAYTCLLYTSDRNIFTSMNNVNLNCILGTKTNGVYKSFLEDYDKEIEHEKEWRKN